MPIGKTYSLLTAELPAVARRVMTVYIAALPTKDHAICRPVKRARAVTAALTHGIAWYSATPASAAHVSVAITAVTAV